MMPLMLRQYSWLVLVICTILMTVDQSYCFMTPLSSGRIRIQRPFVSCDETRFGVQARRNSNYDDDDYDDDDDDDDDYIDVDELDTANFRPPSSSQSIISYGFNRGRSAPSQRKAMGTSKSGTTSVYVCTNCGSESVKWMGRCPTCREWNTMQEFNVDRKEQPLFGSSSSRKNTNRPTFSSSSSWLDGSQSSDFENQPVRVTDVYRHVNKTIASNDGGTTYKRPQRLLIPNDDELNTVLGGGLMTGSLTLLGGDPGVGKSTLLLQTAGSLASLSTPTRGIGMGLAADNNDEHRTLGPVWYVSGEENAEQIASRASRLGIDSTELWLLSETHVDTLAEQVVVSYHDNGPKKTSEGEEIPGQINKPPSLLVIDSIQTMICEAGGTSAAGGITQVRECVALFLRLAKSTGIPIILVGHVTKSGDVAGPRTVEHMVDCVLYLEGGSSRTIGGVNLRMLRAAKNRFGSADEVGVYEMTSGRLCPISDPSSLFLSNRIEMEDPEGCAVVLAVEGLRAMTVEIQALVTPVVGGADGKAFGRRTVDGISYSRLLLLLGVLQKRCGIYVGKQDIYINVVGHMKLDQNTNEGHSSDLGVAVSIVSSFLAIPVRGDTAFVGEVGLLGELRTVPAMEKRIQEARRMGFSRVVTPPTTKNQRHRKKSSSNNQKEGTRFTRIDGVDWIQCDRLYDAINEGLVAHMPKRSRKRKTTTGQKAPGTLKELMLDDDDDSKSNIILDDDEDDDVVEENYIGGEFE